MGYSKDQIDQMFNTRMRSVMTKIDRDRQDEETRAYNDYIVRQEDMAKASMALSALDMGLKARDRFLTSKLAETYGDDPTKAGAYPKKFEKKEGFHPFAPTQETEGYAKFKAEKEKVKAEKQQLIEDKRSALRTDVPIAEEDEFFDEEVTVDAMPDDLILPPADISHEDLQKMNESAKKALYDQYYQGQAEGLHPERVEEIPDYQTWQKMVEEGEASGKYTEKIPHVERPDRPDVSIAEELVVDEPLVDEDIIETPDDLILPSTRPTDISPEDLQRIQDKAEATKGWAETDPYAVPGSRDMSLRERRTAQARLQKARPGTIQRGYTQEPIDIAGEFGAEGGLEGGIETYEQQQKLEALRELETTPGVTPEVSADSELEKALAGMEADVKKPSFLKKSLQTLIPGGEKGFLQKGKDVGAMTASAGTSDVFTPTGEKLGDTGVKIPDVKPDLLKTGKDILGKTQDVAGALGQIKTLTGEGTDEEKAIAGTQLTGTAAEKIGEKVVEKAGEEAGKKGLGKALGVVGKGLGAGVGIYTGLKTAFSEEASDVQRVGGGLQAAGSALIGTGIGAGLGAILAGGGTLMSMFGGKKKRRRAAPERRMDLGRFYQPRRF